MVSIFRGLLFCYFSNVDYCYITLFTKFIVLFKKWQLPSIVLEPWPRSVEIDMLEIHAINNNMTACIMAQIRQIVNKKSIPSTISNPLGLLSQTNLIMYF